MTTITAAIPQLRDTSNITESTPLLRRVAADGCTLALVVHLDGGSPLTLDGAWFTVLDTEETRFGGDAMMAHPRREGSRTVLERFGPGAAILRAMR